MPEPNQTPDQNPEQSQQTTGDENLFNEPDPEDLNDPAEPTSQDGGFEAPSDPEVAESNTEDETESQIDSESSTEPEDEPQSEEEDPASDSGAETDPDATSEQEGDEASDEADADDSDAETNAEDTDEVFFDGEHSMYESKEDALEGIEEKDDYIMQLQDQLEDVESQATDRVESLQSEKQELEREVEQLRSAVDNDTVEELAMQEYLPERFQGKTEADFADDEELVEFKQAKLDAKAEYRREKEQEEKRQQQVQQEIQEQHEEAREWVEDNVKAEDFGATSPERQANLEDFLYEEEGEYSRIQKIQFITAAFGETDGKRFLNGLQNDFRGSNSAQSQPEPSTDPSHKESRSSEDEEVAEQVKKSKPSPETPDEKPRTRDNGMDDRTEMEQAFRRSADEQGLL